MTKRRTNDSDDRYFDSGDNPIGLTSAFAPVKGPQSVDYDTEDDPVGLTQAFGPLPDQDEPRVWDEEGKWEGFDWNAGYEGQGAEIPAASEDADAGSAEAAGAAPEEGASPAPDAAAAPAPASEGGSSRGRHAAPEKQLSPRMEKSRRTRKVLIILIILLILLVGFVGYFAYKTVSEAQHGASEKAQQQTQAQTQTQDVIETTTSRSSSETSAKTDAPDLVSLFGKTSDEAIAAIGHGALVTANRPVDDASSAIKTNLNVALTEEPADSKTGTPTVYLGLDKDGKVIQVGYSASASALGFGSLSFADAIGTEHVIEKTLAKIGVDVPEGTVVLPTDKATYSTYASDGTTVVKERCSFEGPIEVNGLDCTWSAVLSYDYKTQIVTGNLNDTVRIIYSYVTMNVEPEPEAEPAPEA